MAEFVPPSEYVKIRKEAFYAQEVPATGTRVLLSEDGRSIRIIIRRADNRINWLDYDLDKKRGIFYPNKEAFVRKKGIAVEGKVSEAGHVVEFRHGSEVYHLSISDLIKYAQHTGVLGTIERRGILGWLKRIFKR